MLQLSWIDVVALLRVSSPLFISFFLPVASDFGC